MKLRTTNQIKSLLCSHIFSVNASPQLLSVECIYPFLELPNSNDVNLNKFLKIWLQLSLIFNRSQYPNLTTHTKKWTNWNQWLSLNLSENWSWRRNRYPEIWKDSHIQRHCWDMLTWKRISWGHKLLETIWWSFWWITGGWVGTTREWKIPGGVTVWEGLNLFMALPQKTHQVLGEDLRKIFYCI